MILDAGVFIALENPSKRRIVTAYLAALAATGEQLATNDVVLAQAWRNPARQVPMRRLVEALTVYPFGDAQTVGERCATAGTSDVVDASLAVLADQLDDEIVTTDPDDMARLGARCVSINDLED